MNDKNQTIYLARVGSYSYGTNTETSDIDLRGASVAPFRSYCDPYWNFEQYEEQVAKGFATDKVIYDIKKFIKLAAQANPNAIETLFVEERFIEEITDEGKFLHRSRDLFVSQEFKRRIFGFANRELEELRSDIEKSKRFEPFTEDEEEAKVLTDHYFTRFHKKQGKRALHVRRLMNMLLDFYQKETIVVFRPEGKELSEERYKDWRDPNSFSDLEKFFVMRETEILHLAEKSQIPDKPDYEKISELCYTLIDDSQYTRQRATLKRIKEKLGAQ